MTFAIVLALFAILLRFYGLVWLPIILGIIALLIALFSGGPSKQPEPDPWEDEAEKSEESPFDTTLDYKTEQYEYDKKADKHF